MHTLISIDSETTLPYQELSNSTITMAVGRANVKRSLVTCRKKPKEGSQGGTKKCDLSPLVPSKQMSFLQFVHRFPPAADATDTSGSSSSWSSSSSSASSISIEGTIPRKSCLSCAAGSDNTNSTTKTSTDFHRKSKQVSFCTHQKSDKVWSIVHSQPINTINTHSYHDADVINHHHDDPDPIWCSNEEIVLHNNHSDQKEEEDQDVASFLIQIANTQSQTALDDCRQVLADYMAQNAILAPADYALLETQLPSALHTFTNPSIHRQIKKHLRSVLAAQEALREEGFRMGSTRSWDFIALRSKKFSVSPSRTKQVS